jgi:hypothetical protein
MVQYIQCLRSTASTEQHKGATVPKSTEFVRNENERKEKKRKEKKRKEKKRKEWEMKSEAKAH